MVKKIFSQDRKTWLICETNSVKISRKWDADSARAEIWLDDNFFGTYNKRADALKIALKLQIFFEQSEKTEFYFPPMKFDGNCKYCDYYKYCDACEDAPDDCDDSYCGDMLFDDMWEGW